ncbi:MAG TPA: hypothetical protein PKD85_12285, partial [Saprospiraceae bacterium]|nr:hypothetical protein [Saprospiraceae bacterium]
MKKSILYCILFIVITSCSKSIDDDGGQDSNKGKLVKKITSVFENNQPEFEEFFYNSEGQLIKSERNSDITTYLFIGNQIKTSRVSKTNGELQSINEINIDAMGRAKLVNTLDKNGKVIAFTEYEYDVNNYVIKVVNGYPNQLPNHREFIVSNGNYIGGKRFTQNKQSRSFEYEYSSKVNKLPYAVYNLFPSNKYFGTPSKNLVKAYREKDLDGKVVYNIEVAYEFDKDGYATK